jgi:hypothetical protein
MIVACTSWTGWARNATPSAAPNARCTDSLSARSDAGQGPWTATRGQRDPRDHCGTPTAPGPQEPKEDEMRG